MAGAKKNLGGPWPPWQPPPPPHPPKTATAIHHHQSPYHSRLNIHRDRDEI